MNYEQYAPLAIRTAKFIDPVMDLHHAHMGIITEVAEIVDCFKKFYIYGKPLDLVHLEEEIGDCYWYLNLLAHVKQQPMQPAIDFHGQQLHDSNGTLKYLFRLAANAGAVAEGSISPMHVQTMLECLCGVFNIDLGRCLERNVLKLAARYGDKYSDYMALNRNTDNEAKAMV